MPAQAFHFSPPASSLQSTASARRGVILLVLLGMLALFGATAFAFVVIASHNAQTAKALQKVDRVAFSPRDDLEEAMRQALRGPSDVSTSSVLRRHSLLEDLYGGTSAWLGGWVVNQYTLTQDDATGWLNPKRIPTEQLPPSFHWPTSTNADFFSSYTPEPFARTLANGQLIDFIVGYTIPHDAYTLIDPDTSSPATAHDTCTAPWSWGNLRTNLPNNNDTHNEAVEFQRHVGGILTIVDTTSPMFNKSTRIVGYRRQEIEYDPSATPPLGYQLTYHHYQILPFEGVDAADTVNYFLTTQSTGFNFMINGAPFAGTGAGYSSTSDSNDAGYDGATGADYPYALLPNSSDPDYHDYVTAYSANEDYDAPDYQNMLLALEQWDGAAMNLTRSPSLHRPALVNYWLQRLVIQLQDGTLASMSEEADAWRALIRPADFAGGNAGLITAIKRRCTLRPLWEDHPHFNGSNSNWTNGDSPYYDATTLGGITDIPRLQSMAERCWGVADLIPGQTYPWFIDADSDGIPDRDVVPWDVDNDGDGVPDSIWVDIGLPVRSLPDGRKYRPLVALHCIDLDGKVNLNTAGSVEQLFASYTADFNPGPADATATPPVPYGYIDDYTIYAQDLTAGNDPAVVADLSRGQGAGTAEISPLPIMPYGQADFRDILLGNANLGFDGRYGELYEGLDGADYRQPSPGYTPPDYDNYYLAPPTPEALTMTRIFGFQYNNYNYYGDVVNAYAPVFGSPLDLKGTLAIGLDFFGQPIYSAMGGTQFDASNTAQALTYGWNSASWAGAAFDTPYELRLGKNAPQAVGLYAGIDNPFTVTELEALLRRNDGDLYRLPDRLRLLLNSDANQLLRSTATTESWDLPVPALAMTPELRAGWQSITPNAGLPQHVSDIIAARIAANTTNGAYVPATDTAISVQNARRVDVAALLSRDVLIGLRMDLNSPFGNGQDDNANNIVDEPGEGSGLAYRQAYARTLYVLMMALVDQDWYPNWDPVIVAKLNQSPQQTPTDLEIAQARARAIAQWAINVVDYRDPDSIMTPFLYDVFPFTPPTGTIVDGKSINTWQPIGPPVWGCERPELLITETFATHDRRMQVVAGPPTKYLNAFRPEGSLFVELYNPWTAAEPRPAEFYRDHAAGTTAAGVRLNQTTPAGGSPVWRLAIYDLPAGSYDPATYMPTGLGTYDPLYPGGGGPGLERLVYFVPDSATLPNASGAGVVTFTPSAANLAPILPNRYCVVGPGNNANTASGANSYNAGTTLLGAPPTSNVTGLRRIQLNPSSDPNALDQVQVFSDATQDDLADVLEVIDYVTDPANPTDGAIQPPVAVMIDQGRSGGTLRDLRLSISEPPTGYPADNGVAYNWQTGYGAQQEPPDDIDRADRDRVWGGSIYDFTTPPGTFIAAFTPGTGPVATAGTTPALRYVHLQRLADPLNAWSATNPYITVDSSPVDLTVFDSEMTATSNNWGTTGTYTQAGGADSLVSRQRGETAAAGLNTQAFWTPLAVIDPTNDRPLPRNAKALGGGASPHTFAGNLGHSLGYLNDFFYDISPLHFGDHNVPPASAGAPGETDASTNDFDTSPFPWLTWLNRPFANPMELLQVPALHSTRLLFAYENDATMASPLERYASGMEGFPHLAAFFSAVDDDESPEEKAKLRGVTIDGLMDGGNPVIIPSTAPRLYRLFEFVNVPSRFVDTQIIGNATLMSAEANYHEFEPPFNNIPTYREPGKINLNTFFGNDISGGGSLVWNSLANDHTLPTWDQFFLARQGFASAVPGNFEVPPAPTPSLPTRIANPFRTPGNVDLLPPVYSRGNTGGLSTDPLVPRDLGEIARGGVDHSDLDVGDVPEGVGINATLLRPPFDATFPVDIRQRVPLFTETGVTPAPTYANPNTNPFFQYQSLQRVSNLTTNRSNVYALWITVGYFEAENVPGFDPGDPVQQHLHRAGYRLGQELGIDTGEVKRHRAFYIIDRSIPAGFIPGQDLNTENTVLLRRFIE